jgi:hypothetical protein
MSSRSATRETSDNGKPLSLRIAPRVPPAAPGYESARQSYDRVLTLLTLLLALRCVHPAVDRHLPGLLFAAPGPGGEARPPANERPVVFFCN